MKYIYDKGDYDGVRKFISQVNWEEKLQNLSLEELWSMIKGYRYITEATKTYVPHFSVDDRKTSRCQKPPWMDEHAMAALRKKKKAYGVYLKSRHGRDYFDCKITKCSQV